MAWSRGDNRAGNERLRKYRQQRTESMQQRSKCDRSRGEGNRQNDIVSLRRDQFAFVWPNRIEDSQGVSGKHSLRLYSQPVRC